MIGRQPKASYQLRKITSRKGRKIEIKSKNSKSNIFVGGEPSNDEMKHTTFSRIHRTHLEKNQVISYKIKFTSILRNFLIHFCDMK